MTVQTLLRLRNPSQLHWWEWVQLAGCVAMVTLLCMLAAGYDPHPAVVAILLHLACDFTCQSAETAANKEQRGRHLLMHALAAGGPPLAIAGIAATNLRAIIAWTTIGVASHYAIDWTRKFGLRSTALAVVLDQVCHLAVIVALTLR